MSDIPDNKKLIGEVEKMLETMVKERTYTLRLEIDTLKMKLKESERTQNTLWNDRNEVFKLWDMHKYRLDIAVKALESLENDEFEEGYFDVAREALKKIREE